MANERDAFITRDIMDTERNFILYRNDDGEELTIPKTVQLETKLVVVRFTENTTNQIDSLRDLRMWVYYKEDGKEILVEWFSYDGGYDPFIDYIYNRIDENENGTFRDWYFLV